MKGIPQDILERMTWRKPSRDLENAKPTLKSITHEPKPCEDCSLTVTDRRIEIRHRNSPIPHWAEKCQNCNLLKHPVTKQFEVNSAEYQAIYKAYLCQRDK